MFLASLLSPESTLWARQYSTSFPLAENPISEGGIWVNGRTTGLDWYDVETTTGKAFGTVAPDGYADPTAVLNGAWGPDQDASAIVFVNDPNSSYAQEVELRLRHTVTAHSITGYEVLFEASYVGIARWNGRIGDWTSIGNVLCGWPNCRIRTGDTVRATIKGNTIKSYINGVQVMEATDNTFTTGNPGIGYNYGVGTTNDQFGFTRFWVTDGLGTSDDSPDRNRDKNLGPRCLVHPQPAVGPVFIRFEGLAAATKVDVQIVDLAGRVIRTLVSEAGNGMLEWDGKNGCAADVVPGVYLLQYNCGGVQGSRRVLLMR
jgi:hypothetical protein